MASYGLPAGRYAVDPLHAWVGFKLQHNQLSFFSSSFSEFDVLYEDGELTGTVKASSIRIENAAFRELLGSPAFFDFEHHQELTFASRRVADSADGSLTVEGQLSIRGVTRTVTGSGTYALGRDMFGNERLAVALESTLDRRDYGFGWQHPLPNGGDSLAWTVTVVIDVELLKRD